MKQYILGLLTAYAILLTAYAAGMHNGKIASAKQACVTTASALVSQAVELDYISTIQKGHR
jgi:hypothetical protein